MTTSIATIEDLKERVLSASEFKAKCLACLDKIEHSGEPITVTGRGPSHARMISSGLVQVVK